MTAIEKKEFPALTGVRFIAASLVFWFHYAEILYGGGPHGFGFYFLRQLNVGVNLFFVLSGFLIAHRYFSLSFTGGFGAYWFKRAARIFPLYFAVLGAALLMYWRYHGHWPDALTVFLNVTLLKGLSEKYYFSVLTQSWSLTVEEMFYLYAPLCFYLIRKKRIFWTQILVLLATGFALSGLASLFSDSAFFGSPRFMLVATFFGRCFEFFVGIYLALLVRKGMIERKGIAFTGGGAALFFALLAALAYYAYSGNRESVNDYALGILLFNFLLPCAIGLFYYGMLVEESWVKKLLATPLVVLLGKSSYAFYLIHIGTVAQVLFYHVTPQLLLLYVLLQVCSVAAYKFYEKPVYFFLLRKARISAKPAVESFERRT